MEFRDRTNMRTIAASLIVAAALLQGCSTVGVISTATSISTPKHGWFDVNAQLVDVKNLRKPSVPLNLCLHLRLIVQGVDVNQEGFMEDSVEWLFASETRKNIVRLLEQSGFALITDRGLDGCIFVELSDTMEDIGLRYLPLLPTVRWTERKIGKMRVTLINSSNHKVTSALTEESVYVQSGLLSDSPNAEYKQKPFDLSRWDFTILGDSVGLEQLNEQLLYQCLQKIQKKVNLEEFFGTPETSVHEAAAPDPKGGWHNNAGGEG